MLPSVKEKFVRKSGNLSTRNVSFLTPAYVRPYVQTRGGGGGVGEGSPKAIQCGEKDAILF